MSTGNAHTKHTQHKERVGQYEDVAQCPQSEQTGLRKQPGQAERTDQNAQPDYHAKSELIEHTLVQNCRNAGAWSPKTPLLGLISGGSDSTALAYALAHQAKLSQIPLAFIHVNHGIRGQAADEDAAFVRTLASYLETPLFEAQIDVPALMQNEGGNLEDIARRERYAAARDALKSLCTHHGLSADSGRLVVAHTLDDRAETFFMRSIVGTGPGGLGSLQLASGDVIRPLLGVTREELRAYLKALAQAGRTPQCFAEEPLWCEDATNADTQYFRSFVRHEMIPRARMRNADLLHTLERTMDVIAEENRFMDELARDAFARCVQIEDTRSESGADACFEPAQRGADSAHLLNHDMRSDEPGGVAVGVYALVKPAFAQIALPIRRRVAYQILRTLLPVDARVEQRSVDAICKMVDDTAQLKSGYTTNIQGNLAISSNKRGGRIEPMALYRARRKPHKHPRTPRSGAPHN